MNKYFEYYSKHGLNQMINDNKNDIEKLKENYKAVEQGLLYNPLCKDENMKEIKRMIVEKEIQIKELEEALNMKK
jgi:hypothetical protein